MRKKKRTKRKKRSKKNGWRDEVEIQEREKEGETKNDVERKELSMKE
jgi:hypothetical protein